MLRTVGEVAGCRAPKRTLPAAAFRIAGHVNVLLANVTGREPELTPQGVAMASVSARVVSTRAEQELGYRPAPLKTMIADSHSWLETQGILRR